MANRESGYYPPGAENDPNAPWNEVEAPEWIKAFHRSYCDICEDEQAAVNHDHICQDCFDKINEQPIEKETDRDDAD